jgi:DNA-binding FadR family transcriptional regulator
MIFKKAKQNRIFQDIVDQVQLAIVTGELVPGEKLPAEREMCAIFNTSRGTLREALRILEQKKLITIKLGAGGGAVVRESNSELIAENIEILIQGKKVSALQLIELTARVFALLASLAATKASTEDIEPLKQLVTNITDVMEQQKKAENIFSHMDALLFEELARIADSPLYSYLLQAMLQIIGQEASYPFSAGEREQKQHYQEIRMIVYAVAKNEQQEAAKLATQHLGRYETLSA